jgi:hypothetical protein
MFGLVLRFVFFPTDRQRILFSPFRLQFHLPFYSFLLLDLLSFFGISSLRVSLGRGFNYQSKETEGSKKSIFMILSFRWSFFRSIHFGRFLLRIFVVLDFKHWIKKKFHLLFPCSLFRIIIIVR